MSDVLYFKGDYAFLSNFWPSPLRFEGEVYPTVEHAYQAAKTSDPAERDRIRRCRTPGQAKRRGRRVDLRHDWDKIKVVVMARLLREKFAAHPDLRAQLLKTTGRLVEGNTWGDRFWGVCGGRGENYLGRLLMRLRDQLREEEA